MQKNKNSNTYRTQRTAAKKRCRCDAAQVRPFVPPLGDLRNEEMKKRIGSTERERIRGKKKGINYELNSTELWVG